MTMDHMEGMDEERRPLWDEVQEILDGANGVPVRPVVALPMISDLKVSAQWAKVKVSFEVPASPGNRQQSNDLARLARMALSGNASVIFESLQAELPLEEETAESDQDAEQS